MENIASFIAGAFLFGFFGLIFGISRGWQDNTHHWHRITIERGLAQYCPDTGVWAWIGECE